MYAAVDDLGTVVKIILQTGGAGTGEEEQGQAYGRGDDRGDRRIPIQADAEDQHAAAGQGQQGAPVKLLHKSPHGSRAGITRPEFCTW